VGAKKYSLLKIQIYHMRLFSKKEPLSKFTEPVDISILFPELNAPEGRPWIEVCFEMQKLQLETEEFVKRNQNNYKINPKQLRVESHIFVLWVTSLGMQESGINPQGILDRYNDYLIRVNGIYENNTLLNKVSILIQNRMELYGQIYNQMINGEEDMNIFAGVLAYTLKNPNDENHILEDIMSKSFLELGATEVMECATLFTTSIKELRKLFNLYKVDLI
jgi:hypothetical protein